MRSADDVATLDRVDDQPAALELGITLEVGQKAPILSTNALSDEEKQLLDEWLLANPELRALAIQAVRLAEAE